MGGVREAVGRLDDAMLGLRDRLTPGQRWTSALLLALVSAVLLYGAPVQRIVAPAGPVPLAPAGLSAAGPGPASAEAAPFAAVVGGTALASALERPVGPDTITSTDPGLGEVDQRPAPSLAPSPALEVLRIAAVLPPAGAAPPGRGQGDIANRFLSLGGFAAEQVTAPAAGTAGCDKVAPTAQLILAGDGLDSALLACLAARAVVVAHHEGGPTTSAGGALLSTRRGAADALLDVGRWARRPGVAPLGRAALLSGSGDRARFEPLVPALRAAGINIVSTAFVADDPGAVAAALRSFADADVATVVVAAPAGVRRHLAAQRGLLDPGSAIVLADAHDGTADEAYPATFDGALAVTSSRLPWYSRDHGETAEQKFCRETWEAVATPKALLGATETRWVYLWCQQAALAATVLRAGAHSRNAGEVLQSIRVNSPLTADLAALADGSWGPSADAVIVWRAACACWQERESFRPR